MSELSKREILKRANEFKRKEEVPKEIRSIDEALKEKEIRETQNLKIKLEQDRLCAEMMNMEQIAAILNSTTDAQAGCPIKQPNQKVEYKHVTCNHQCNLCNEVDCVEREEEMHSVGCHCSKCCPNPRKNWLQRHKHTIAIVILWLALIVLGVGWSPSGGTFDAIQKSYVELIVNFFKMSIFAVAGVVTWILCKRDNK